MDIVSIDFLIACISCVFIARKIIIRNLPSSLLKFFFVSERKSHRSTEINPQQYRKSLLLSNHRFYNEVHFKFVVLPALLLIATACGSAASKENGTAAATTNTSTSTNNRPASDSEDELSGKPVYQAGQCKDSVGCLRGFISHGTKLTLTPETNGKFANANGEEVTFTTVAFKDAADFGDRFDTAFLLPLVAKDKAEQYDFKIAPLVKRDNFAAGFELYSESDSASMANDEHVKMEGEGNFIIGDLEVAPDYVLRAVKTFRIVITKKTEAEDGTPAVTRAITCLNIAAELSNLDVKAGNHTKVGGLRNFNFYYSEDDTLCKEDVVGEAQSRDISATTLPTTGPDIP